MIIKKNEELLKIKSMYIDRVLRRSGNKGKSDRVDILVGMATCGIAAGAQEVFDVLSKQVAELNDPNIKVVPVGCMGYCHSEPTVVVCQSKKHPVIYGNVDSSIANKIFDEHIVGHSVVKSHTMEMEFNRTLEMGESHGK